LKRETSVAGLVSEGLALVAGSAFLFPEDTLMPVKRETTVAGLASEGLARISGITGAGSSEVVGPAPTFVLCFF